MKTFNLDKRIITYKMEGKSFDNGFDFHDTLASLNHFQNILDKAYLTIVNKERMSKTDRDVFKIKATGIKQGSFITDFVLYIGAAIQITYPIINTYHPSLLLDIIKEGFMYLRTILTANKDGKKISLTANGDIIMINLEENCNSPIYVGSNAYIFAGKSYDDFKGLASIIDDEKIKTINVIDKAKKKKIMKMGSEEKEIFKLESRLDEEPIFVKGKIFRIDVRAKSGKLIVCDSHDVNLIKKEFNFEILVDEDIDKCCSVIGKEAKFGVLKRIQFDPITLKEQIKSLRIFKVDL